MPFNNFEAFLHIIHVSDIHCRDGSSPTDLRAERLVQNLVKLLRRAGSRERANLVEVLWEQGLAGHDPCAHEKMCRFLRWFAHDKQFGGIETWLLDTGDLSSMGDIGSLQTACKWLQEYQAILKASELLVLYGNHDAWPGQFPLAAPKAALDAHRKALRGSVFPPLWPQGPLCAAIPHTQSRLLLSSVNSAIDDRWYNSWALGRVDIDPNWVEPEAGTDQLQKLADDTEQGFHADRVTRDFRILAVHHPVHYPPPRPSYQMSLKNDSAVADALIRFDQKRRGKLAHLVLSGHTHVAFPALGALPAFAVGQYHQPLTHGQLQLIAGSLAQMPRAADRAAAGRMFVPQQFQILTFFAPPPGAPHQQQLLIERRLVGRPGGTGDYKILSRPKAPVEAVLMDY
ncbi:MAG: metallophosphoesterase [Pseudomonadota bacterium]